MYLFLWKYFSRQIYSYGFHISKLNNLKIIHDLYFLMFDLNIVKKYTTFGRV
jgi:hypothetical protein